MGSWGTGVLENDDAVGIECAFEDFFGYAYDSPSSEEITAERVNAFLEEKCYSCETVAAAAQMFISVGAIIDDKASKMMLGAIETLSDHEVLSDWEDPNAREESLIALRDALTAYIKGDDAVLLPQNKGLIETIADGLWGNLDGGIEQSVDHGKRFFNPK